jgi:hypothetical protein
MRSNLLIAFVILGVFARDPVDLDIDNSCQLSAPRHSSGPVETVPIFLKFHKVGSTTITTLLQTLCSTSWWNATDSKAARDADRGDFCCSDPFWHQTIHQVLLTSVT